MTDDDFGQDIDEIKKNISVAEVMSIFFPTLRRSVVIDTRINDRDGPMVRIMLMVASPEERLRSLRKLRPGFPRVQNLSLIPWSRYVDSLVGLGIWECLVNRFRNLGHTGAVEECELVLQELRAIEKKEMAYAVRGDNYHTIWSAY